MSNKPLNMTALFNALDNLSLTPVGGLYSTIKASISESEARELAEIFFKALGGVGTSRFSIRLIHNEKDIHPSLFLSARIGNGLIDHVRVKDRVLQKYLNDGATVVFDHINDHIPIAQQIQDHVEALTGAHCWIQCYITQASSSAFNMHQDDHAFAIVQLHGRKEWRHAPEAVRAPASTIYSPGSVAFYPKGMRHDVYGLGELTMHLTIAFEGDASEFEVPSDTDITASTVGDIRDYRRRGTGLPYSLNPELITASTPARLALRYLPKFSGNSKVIKVWTGTSKLALAMRYAEPLRHLALSPSTTASELSAAFDFSVGDAVSFYRFGFVEGLLLSPVQ